MQKTFKVFCIGCFCVKKRIDFLDMKKRGFILIVIAGVLWGTSSIFVHFLSPLGFSSLQMTFFRSLVAFLSMAVYVLLFNKRLFKVTKKELLLFALSGLSFFGTASFYYTGMIASSVSTAVVLMYSSPVLVMIYSVIFFGEKLSVKKVISIVAMLTGCCLVSGIIGGMKFSLWGITASFLAGVCYTAYNIFTKIQMRNESNPVSATLYCFLFASLAAFFACEPAQIPTLITVKPFITVLLILGIGICTGILPYFLYTVSLKDLEVGTASALGIIEPMSATIFSVVLFGEPLSVFSVVGIVLILGAVLLLSRSEE